MKERSQKTLNLKLRNYWSRAKYDQILFELTQNGNRTQTDFFLLDFEPDKNFNIWNLDINFELWFAPGSNMVFLYRNQLFTNDNVTDLDYFASLSNLFDQPTQHQFSIRINYTDNLKLITAKHDTKLHALADIELENITIKNYDSSRSFLNVKSKLFAIMLNDKSEAELNIKADNTTIEVSKDAEVKALIASPIVKIDLYQKGKAIIEGDAASAKVRLDNSSDLIAKNFTISNLEITTESYSKAIVNVAKNIKTNVRELEGAIISLIAQASFNRKEFTLSLTSFLELVVKKLSKVLVLFTTDSAKASEAVS